MIASHVMFVALLIEEVDTVSVDIRMLCASFTYAVFARNSVLFALQTNRVATPVQLNSATELNEVLTDLGGVVISTQ